ncbi:MAG: DUF4037 domain-containing protein [Lachnospiraceae bacterium]|nr:DUF4037 domain-containing protein [Lachnospiraceae bacterium]
MQGLELARIFYDEHVEPMLREQFPEVMDHITVGLTGSGSECYGFDDSVSEDHDFEPGVCIFLPGGDLVDSRTEFRLSRAYAALPEEICGYRRSRLSPVGGGRHGVIRAADFWNEKLGLPDGMPDDETWLRLPEYALAEAVNGEIFWDGDGSFTGVRKYLRHYPQQVRMKKLAGYLLLMNQAGMYNYRRCLKHGEEAAAQLAVFEYVKAAMHAIFLLNDRYMPYYKWSFRAMHSLPALASLCESLDYLMTTGNDPDSAVVKTGVISDIDRAVESVVKLSGLVTERTREIGVGLTMGARAAAASSGQRAEEESTKASEGFFGSSAPEVNLERLAYELNDSIADGSLRNLHILTGVE